MERKRIETAAAHITNIVKKAENEEQLKLNVENVLAVLCREEQIPWDAYTYEHHFSKRNLKADAIHGAVVIEYEAPACFDGGLNARHRHARMQAEAYAEALSEEEGRSLSQYSLLAWDGATLSFGCAHQEGFVWEDPEPFGTDALARLIEAIRDNGLPLVSPAILTRKAGPDTEVGKEVIGNLFRLLCGVLQEETTTRTKLIYTEWARLFGQTDGTETDRVRDYLSTVQRESGIECSDNPHAYLFALNTYIAVVAKICAVMAISQDAGPASGRATGFLKEMESGSMFRACGVLNMLSTDFFSWYQDFLDSDADLISAMNHLVNVMRQIDFGTTKKTASSVRDLFKGLYMDFVPASVRHSLGEYYTPDPLASHVLTLSGWEPENTILDPCCGSGTFLLEALKRRMESHPADERAETLLQGIAGTDLNPLAVLTTKASLVVFLAGRFDPAHPVLLPVYLADAINTADPVNGLFEHDIPTEIGNIRFRIPQQMAGSSLFFEDMDFLRLLIEQKINAELIRKALSRKDPVIASLSDRYQAVLDQTISTLADMQDRHWDGVWCLILFDRIKAGQIRDVDFVVGNPPWVKWSHLPRPYAEFIKPLCRRLDVFSDAFWVGGIQSDISTVITYHAMERFLKNGGTLAFLITGTVFQNESSQGFRRWALKNPDGTLSDIEVLMVENYVRLRPFGGTGNVPTLLLVQKNGRKTQYPVPYRIYEKPDSPEEDPFSHFQSRYAIPVPGKEGGPWLIGSKEELTSWPHIFRSETEPDSCHARKGVTTDANGIYFIHVDRVLDGHRLMVHNEPGIGKRKEIVPWTGILEDADVFPLLRGRDVGAFRISRPANQYVIVPQRGMSGDPDLPASLPGTFAYLSHFADILKNRSSYRRFQKNSPFWSIWSTGPYTFSPYKVLWKEMSGGKFEAAYCSSYDCPWGVDKVIVPDHKLYFIPCSSEEEAAFITAYLNSSLVSSAISAYANALSLGTSVTEYIRIPVFDPSDTSMQDLCVIGKKAQHGRLTPDEVKEQMDGLVRKILAVQDSPKKEA